MTLNSFLIYIGTFLACSVALSAVVNQMVPSFAASGKKPYLYGLLSSVLASGAGYFATLTSNYPFTVFWFLAAVYLLFGSVHVFWIRKRYFNSSNTDKTKAAIGEIFFGLSVICFSIVVFSSLKHFLPKDREFLFYPTLFSCLAFFLPYLFLETFEAAFAIPPAIFPTWKYPDQVIEVPDDKPGEKLLVIGFEIAKKPADINKTYFRAKAPEGMQLGELYYHFINDYNDTQSETTIVYSDEGYNPHEWWFRLKRKWYQFERVLDPTISVRENGIKENTVIICERLSNTNQY